MMGILYAAGAAFLGGVVAALLGWLDSKEPFNGRKFGASLLRALVAGVSLALVYTAKGDPGPTDLALAFLAGAGIDVLGNRAAGTMRGGK